jgi:hypothetical protein
MAQRQLGQYQSSSGTTYNIKQMISVHPRDAKHYHHKHYSSIPLYQACQRLQIDECKNHVGDSLVSVKSWLAGKDFTASRWQRKESLEESVDIVTTRESRQSSC